MVEKHRGGEGKEGEDDGGPSKGCNYAYCGGCGAYLGTTAGPAGREPERSTRKAAVFLVGAVAALFVARLLRVYLDY
ncbi:hypothetical protein IMZ48_21905 [Candidatus Bathyarchaeota archaeon]|nr:hypothetical protein [Candidatus Bathyarchaeota archaeon]